MPDTVGRITVPTRIQLRPDLPAEHAIRLRLFPTLSELYDFWVLQNGGLMPFALNNSFEVAADRRIGSNYDPTGNNTQGCLTVVFRGNQAQATDVARTNVHGLELVGGSVDMVKSFSVRTTACAQSRRQHLWKGLSRTCGV